MSTASTTEMGATYVGDFPQGPPWWMQSPPLYAPSPQYIWNTGNHTRVGHANSDPTVVNHCPFCGSGKLTGRSDGAVDCGLCDETFRVSREPLYSNIPSNEPGAGVESFEIDPLHEEESFEPGDEEIVTGDEQPPGEEQPAGDEDPSEDEEKPPFIAALDGGLRNGRGVPLDEESFVRHHAFRDKRGQ